MAAVGSPGTLPAGAVASGKITGPGNLQRVTDLIMPTSNFPSSSQEVCWSVVNSRLSWGGMGWNSAL